MFKRSFSLLTLKITLLIGIEILIFNHTYEYYFLIKEFLCSIKLDFFVSLFSPLKINTSRTISPKIILKKMCLLKYVPI
jgi:hypothetical protein